MTKRGHAYHHGDLRRTLVGAALRIVEQSGAGALSLRELARKAGVSHAAPYRHFASREALLAALATEGFLGLSAEMQACAGAERDPLRRLRALGLAYVRHAVAHPGHFKVMFSRDLDANAQAPELQAAAEPTLRSLVACIADGQSAGLIRHGDPRRLAVPAWSVVHGLSMLLIDRQLAPLLDGKIDVDAEAHAAIDVIALGLRPAPAKKRRRARRPVGDVS